MLRLSSIALHQLECIRRANTHNTNTHSTTYMWTQWSRNGQRSGPFHVQRIPSNALVYLTKSKGISYVLQFVALVRCVLSVRVEEGTQFHYDANFLTGWRKYQRNNFAELTIYTWNIIIWQLRICFSCLLFTSFDVSSAYYHFQNVSFLRICLGTLLYRYIQTLHQLVTSSAIAIKL